MFLSVCSEIIMIVLPSQKDFTIADLKNSNFERIKPELDKCILLCNRCHAEVHAGMHPTLYL